MRLDAELGKCFWSRKYARHWLAATNISCAPSAFCFSTRNLFLTDKLIIAYLVKTFVTFNEGQEVTYVVKKLFCFYGKRKFIIFIYNSPSLVSIIIKLNPVHHPPAPASFLRPILILLSQYSFTINALPPCFATDKRIEVNRFRPL